MGNAGREEEEEEEDGGQKESGDDGRVEREKIFGTMRC